MGNVLDLTANIGDAIVQFHDWVAEHNLLAKAIQFVIPYVKQESKKRKIHLADLKRSYMI